MITTITKRAVSGRLLTHVVGATFRLRDIAPAIFRRLKPAATILLILWCVAPGSSASAKEFGVVEDLYVGRNTTTPYGGIGRYQNMLKYSEDFTQNDWTVTILTATNNQIAPNGVTNSACELKNSTAASGYIEQGVTIAAAAAADYTFSVWIKAGILTSAALNITFNGTSPTNGSSGALTLDSTWQRFSVKGTTSASSNTTIITVRITNNSAVLNGTILVWGGQLEQADTAGVYAKASSLAITAGRGVVSAGDIVMPGLKLTEGDITNVAGNTITLDDNVAVTGDLEVTGDGPHYISQGNVGIGTTAPAAPFDVYNKPANASGAVTTALINPDYSLLNTTGDGYTALKVNVTEALAGASGAKKLMDLQVANTSKFNVDNSGNVTSGTINSQTIGSNSILHNLTISDGSALTIGDGYGADKHGIVMAKSGSDYNIQVSGDVIFKGKVLSENAQQVLVKNNIIILNQDGSAQDAYIKVYATNGQMRWNSATSKWQITNDGSNFNDIAIPYTAGDGLDLASQQFSVDVTDLIGAGLSEDASNNLILASTAAGGGLTYSNGIISSANTDGALSITADSIDLSSAVAGDGLSLSGGALAVRVDNSTIEIAADQLRIKDSGVTSAKILDSTIAAADISSGAIIKSKLNELRPHAQATPNNTCYVESGIVSISNNAKLQFGGGSSPVFNSVASGARTDLLVLNSSGSLEVLEGQSTYPANKLVIAEVAVNEIGAVVINDSDITDVRPFLNLGVGTSTVTDDTYINSAGGDTMTGTLTFSGIDTDIATAANEDLNIMPNGTGKVGIGTLTPAYKLDVNGIINAANIYKGGQVFKESQWSDVSGGIYYTSGKVGLGTASPTANLDIKGNLSTALTGTIAITNASANVTGTGTTFDAQLAVNDAIKIGSEVFTVSAIGSAVSMTLDSNYQGATASGLTAYKDSNLFFIQNGDGISQFTIDKSGNVVIDGSLTADSLIGPSLTSGTSSGYFAIDSDYNEVNPQLRFQTGASAYQTITYDETNTEFDFSQDINLGANNLVTSSNLTDGTNSLTIANAKTAYDHVSATTGTVHGLTLANVSQLGSSIESAEITNSAIINEDISNTAEIAGAKISPNFGSQSIITMGNVGIGTTSPSETLHVVGNITATGTISGANLGGGNNTFITFRLMGILIPMTDIDGGVYIPADSTIKSVSVYRDTAGASSNTIVDININDTSIFTTQANRPAIAFDDADKKITVTNMNVTALSAGNILSCDVDQVETGNPEDIIVTVEIQ